MLSLFHDLPKSTHLISVFIYKYTKLYKLSVKFSKFFMNPFLTWMIVRGT